MAGPVAALMTPRFCRMASVSSGEDIGIGPTYIIGSSCLRYCMVISGRWLA